MRTRAERRNDAETRDAERRDDEAADAQRDETIFSFRCNGRFVSVAAADETAAREILRTTHGALADSAPVIGAEPEPEPVHCHGGGAWSPDGGGCHDGEAAGWCECDCDGCSAGRLA